MLLLSMVESLNLTGHRAWAICCSEIGKLPKALNPSASVPRYTNPKEPKEQRQEIFQEGKSGANGMSNRVPIPEPKELEMSRREAEGLRFPKVDDIRCCLPIRVPKKMAKSERKRINASLDPTTSSTTATTMTRQTSASGSIDYWVGKGR